MLANSQNPIGGRVLHVGVRDECLTREIGGLSLYAFDEFENV